MLSAAEHMQRLDDPHGQWDARQAAQVGDGWQPLAGNLGAGFTSAAIWLRLVLHVPEPRMENGTGWMLHLDNAVLDDVQFYVRSPVDDDWSLLGHTGEDVPRRLWPVDYRSPVVAFLPKMAGDHEVMVRLRSKNSITTQLNIWQRLAFDNYSRREGLLFGLHFGFYLLLIVLHGAFWGGTRAPASGLFLIYIGSSVSSEILAIGLIQQITGMSVIASDRLLAAGVAICFGVGGQLHLKLLGLSSLYPRTARILVRLFWSIGGILAILGILGAYVWSMMGSQIFSLLVIVFISPLIAVFLLSRGHIPPRLWIVAQIVFFIGLVIAYLRNLGYFPVNGWTQYASTIGTTLHMLLIGVLIIGRHEYQRRLRERQQADLAAELELERRTYAEQREFISMVSHEFRTPLAIITTTAQQLGRNLRAPVERNLARCAHIREAAQRLLVLVDEYLTEDRMRQPHPTLYAQDCNFSQLLDDLAREFSPGRVDSEIAPDAQTLCSDASLLRIALRNLLANADRHTPVQSTIQVSIYQEHRSGKSWLHIEVANPGAAIPPTECERIFQKYYRGQNALHRPGAGLGLYLVRSIAQRLGGTVILHSPGGDVPVCFRLSLPSTLVS